MRMSPQWPPTACCRCSVPGPAAGLSSCASSPAGPATPYGGPLGEGRGVSDLSAEDVALPEAQILVGLLMPA
jgi:hypothetical protein